MSPLPFSVWDSSLRKTFLDEQEHKKESLTDGDLIYHKVQFDRRTTSFGDGLKG